MKEERTKRKFLLYIELITALLRICDFLLDLEFPSVDGDISELPYTFTFPNENPISHRFRTWVSNNIIDIIDSSEIIIPKNYPIVANYFETRTMVDSKTCFGKKT